MANSDANIWLWSPSSSYCTSCCQIEKEYPPLPFLTCDWVEKHYYIVAFAFMSWSSLCCQRRSSYLPFIQRKPLSQGRGDTAQLENNGIAFLHLSSKASSYINRQKKERCTSFTRLIWPTLFRLNIFWGEGEKGCKVSHRNVNVAEGHSPWPSTKSTLNRESL